MATWVWNTETLSFEPGDASGALLLADSWFVRDGCVRSLPAHRQRFTATAAKLGIVRADLADVPEVWSQIVSLLPKTGDWFPRVEFIGEENPSLVFRLRPAPERTQQLHVWVPPFSDVRHAPTVKGPDIERLEQLRTRAANELGCQEVLLLTPKGYVLEGATSSILWWERDALCVPDPELGTLPGVTTSLLQQEARARCIPVEFRKVTPAQLDNKEVWLVNALHGLRRVAMWRGEINVRGQTQPAARNLTAPAAQEQFWQWREWLESQRVPVAAGSNIRRFE